MGPLWATMPGPNCGPSPPLFVSPLLNTAGVHTGHTETVRGKETISLRHYCIYLSKSTKVLVSKYSRVSVRLSLFLSPFLCDLCEHQWCSIGGSHTGADWDHNSSQASWPRECPKCPKMPQKTSMLRHAIHHIGDFFRHFHTAHTVTSV